MYDDTPLRYFDIIQGGTFEDAWQLHDSAGDPLRASAGWTGRLQLRTNYGGPLVATFGTGGNGSLTIDEDGHVIVVLPSAFTQAMTPTVSSSGANNRVLVGDLEVFRTSAPNVKHKPTIIRARVYPEATTT